MTTSLPTGACNAHCHVFGPARPLSVRGQRTPSLPAQDAPREALYALNDRLGLQRCVIVQSTCHGLDNSVTEHAIAGRPLTTEALRWFAPMWRTSNWRA
jgi:2-pyrone-4,6-dicarboxylate lactonase